MHLVSSETIWLEVLDQILSLLLREARADPYVLQITGAVIESKQKRADGCSGTLFVPAKAGDDAVAVAFMFDLEHGSLIRLVGSVGALRHDSIQAGTFEAVEPIGGGRRILGCGGDVQGLFRIREHAFQLVPPLHKG